MAKKKERMFLREDALPEGSYTQVSLPGTDRSGWYTTGMLPKARNHCGAVAAANTAACLLPPDAPGRSTLLEEAYRRIGNGPVLRIGARTKKLLSRLGWDCTVFPVSREYQAHFSVLRGFPVILMTGRAPWHLHWVVVVGERFFESGERYLTVADGWHRELRFLECGEPVDPVHAVAFSLNSQV